MMPETRITLELLPEKFALCRLPQETAAPADLPYMFWAQTPEEKSLVCPEPAVPPDAQHVRTGMRALRVAGTLDLSLVGILSRLYAVLAAAGVPLFAVSTWDTDYLFVPEDRLEAARAAFGRAGIPVSVPNV